MTSSFAKVLSNRDAFPRNLLLSPARNAEDKSIGNDLPWNQLDTATIGRKDRITSTKFCDRTIQTLNDFFVTIAGLSEATLLKYPSRMKTLLRTLLYLALIVWLGAEVFFPVVAAVSFTTQPNTHLAGAIVGQLLRILHSMGLVAGIVALALLALAPTWNIYKARVVIAPMILLVLMLACTAYSQFGIIPAMERDRIAAGGAINTADNTDPNTQDFNKLHNRSTFVEEAVLLFGLITVVLVARAETASAEQPRFATALK
jgi:hypothetical protein